MFEYVPAKMFCSRCKVQSDVILRLKGGLCLCAMCECEIFHSF